MFRISRTLLALTLVLSVFPLLTQAQSSGTAGAVFVMTNDANHNQVIAYHRNADGSLTGRHTYATGGRGSGGVNDPSRHRVLLPSRKIIHSFSRLTLAAETSPCSGSTVLRWLFSVSSPAEAVNRSRSRNSATLCTSSMPERQAT